MDKTEIERQRNIGKQMLLVDILHAENEKARNGAFCFVSKDTMSNWASMEKEEFDKFFEMCSWLSQYPLANDVARGCARREEYKCDINAYAFIRYSYLHLGGSVLVNQCLFPNAIESLCEINAEEHYKTYMKKYTDYPVQDKYSSVGVLSDILQFYLDSFIELANEALSRGYDWDVICRMRGLKLSQDILKKNCEIARKTDK